MKVSIDQRPNSLSTSHWSEVEPFFDNSRAALIHRPRYVTEHQISDSYPKHLSVEAWCGTVFSGKRTFSFVDRIPDGRLLCERCEVRAFAKGLPPASSIVGGHVHLGRVVAQQTCCQHGIVEKGN